MQLQLGDQSEQFTTQPRYTPAGPPLDRRFQKFEERSCGNPGEMAARMERYTSEGIGVQAGQAQLISRVMSGGEQDITSLVHEIWPQKSDEFRRAMRENLWEMVAELHTTMFLKIERLIKTENEEPCVRQVCPCEANYNGREEEYCCITCRDGTPCEENHHRKR